MVVPGAELLLQPGGQDTGAGSSDFQSKLCLFSAARCRIKSFTSLFPNGLICKMGLKWHRL